MATKKQKRSKVRKAETDTVDQVPQVEQAEPVETDRVESDTVEQTEPAEQPPEPVEEVEQIEPVEQFEQDEWFEAAVVEGKQLANAIGTNKWKLGELADDVGSDSNGDESEYGTARLARLAERIDVLYETLKRYRSVFRAYKDIDIGALTPSFTVLSELAAVKNRADHIRANPNMTAIQAREIARAYNDAKAVAAFRGMNERAASAANATNPTETVTSEDEADADFADAEENDATHSVTSSTISAGNATKGKQKKLGKTKNVPGWYRDAVADAQKANSKYGHARPEDIDADILREVFPDPNQAASIIRRNGDAQIRLADLIDDALYNHPAPEAPMRKETPEAPTASVQ